MTWLLLILLVGLGWGVWATCAPSGDVLADAEARAWLEERRG